MVDYYKILEVNKGASNSDIKKAYRRLALKWHPDKNPDNADEANKRFKEISEAYEVLSDDKKRRIYDQYGVEGLNGFGGGRGGAARHYEDDMDFGFTFTFRDPEEVFREFFGGSPFANLFRGSGSGRARGHSGHQDTLTQMFSPFGSFGLGFDDMFTGFEHGGGGGGVQFTSFSSSFNGPANGVTKKTTTSTRFINGKKITTKKVIENGKETVMQYENDVLKSKTINGVNQAISYS
ncbi:hypothetical protein O3M35_013350 [Rhynocoris fuscipes]|uniref:J domain-containing protein n=1 Tax=Rhynocoris fuscipes TaxID=488301 RepID=A0AAW1CEB9_9HEMI